MSFWLGGIRREGRAQSCCAVRWRISRRRSITVRRRCARFHTITYRVAELPQPDRGVSVVVRPAAECRNQLAADKKNAACAPFTDDYAAFVDAEIFNSRRTTVLARTLWHHVVEPFFSGHSSVNHFFACERS